MRSEAVAPIEVEAVDATGAAVASGYPRLSREWHLDEVIGREFDVNTNVRIEPRLGGLLGHLINRLRLIAGRLRRRPLAWGES